MSGCLGCSCDHAARMTPGNRVVFGSGVQHTVQAIRSALRGSGADVVERHPGLVEAGTPDAGSVLTAVRERLSSVEAAEVRALVVSDESGDELLAAALAAPSLATLCGRVEHASLLPLFADELAAFHSVYQPIVDLTGTSRGPDGHAAAPATFGFEALLRATRAGQPVMPLDLFAAAEDAGWLHVLDRIGRTTALRGAAGWLGDAMLFVNFLPTTIYRPEVCLATTEKAAEQAGLRLDQLVFEVTESQRVTDLAHLKRVFEYYRMRGCKVALDDLGAGYSSLNVLVSLQPDIVKLDKEIVQHLPDPASTAVIAAVVEIAHSYGGKVLAECVETAEQAAIATELGVDLGQGWYFGRPAEAPSFQASSMDDRTAHPASDPQQASALQVTGNDPAVALLNVRPRHSSDTLLAALPVTD